jgi:soluble lytic murein transglycosylase
METNEKQPITKKQKTVLIVLAMIAACLIITSVTVFWILPNVLKSRFKLEHVDLIKQYSEEYCLDPALVCGVIYTESGFKEDATSRVGAKGLMQIMPQTGQEIADALGEPFSEQNLYLADVSIRYGCYYLRQQLDRFDQNEAIALAAYNAGPHRAELWLSEYGLDSKGHIRYIPFGETDRYVDKVLQAKENYANLYAKELAIDTEDAE